MNTYLETPPDSPGRAPELLPKQREGHSIHLRPEDLRSPHVGYRTSPVKCLPTRPVDKRKTSNTEHDNRKPKPAPWFHVKQRVRQQQFRRQAERRSLLERRDGQLQYQRQATWRLNEEEADELAAHSPAPPYRTPATPPLRQSETGSRPTPASCERMRVAKYLPSRSIHRVEGNNAQGSTGRVPGRTD